jgi:hypothetical protein
LAITIITKNSTVAGVAPSSGQLSIGELAVNVTDKKLYTLDSSNNVVLLGGPLTVGVSPISGATNGFILYNNSNVLGAKATTGSGNVVLATSAALTTPVISSIVNTGTLTLPTSTDTLVGRATTDTLTNKRITPRVLASTANSATPTLNTDNYDMMVITGQSVAITSFSTNLTGTPTNGQKLWISVTGTTGIAISWGASFEASTIPLPTSTTTTLRLDVAFVWNVATSKWRCLAYA